MRKINNNKKKVVIHKKLIFQTFGIKYWYIIYYTV